MLMKTGAQERESSTGERAEEALKESVQAEARQYNIRTGPVAWRLGSGVRVGYTDNVFYTESQRKNDVVIIPEVSLAAFTQLSELNTFKLSTVLSYEYYLKNSTLNEDAPLINPGSELSFNVFVSNLHIRPHDAFSYQQTLFYNTIPSAQDILYNFSNTGVFKRWDNFAGLTVDWDLDRFILSAGYDHENFESSTASFEYLNRASEWLNISSAWLIGDQVRIGLESKAGLHQYETQTTLNDHWQARGGPFFEMRPQQQLTFRLGGGYDTAQYEDSAPDSDFSTYYAYGWLRQETRLFSHSLSAGHEHLLGNNANNLRTTYVRYSITSPVINHWELGATAAVHFAEEFGGAFNETFTYCVAGARIGYQIHKYWRTDLGYEFMFKDSDLPLRSFHRNRVTIGVSFTF
jgi:hypothetical protein